MAPILAIVAPERGRAKVLLDVKADAAHEIESLHTQYTSDICHGGSYASIAQPGDGTGPSVNCPWSTTDNT